MKKVANPVNKDIKLVADKKAYIIFNIPVIFANFISFPIIIKPILKTTTRAKISKFSEK